MYTSLGDPPWLVVGAPMPRPGNITASTATIAAPTATAVEGFNADGVLIALPLLQSGLVFHGATHDSHVVASQSSHARVLSAGDNQIDPSTGRGSRPGRPSVDGHALAPSDPTESLEPVEPPHEPTAGSSRIHEVRDVMSVRLPHRGAPRSWSGWRPCRQRPSARRRPPRASSAEPNQHDDRGVSG